MDQEPVLLELPPLLLQAQLELLLTEAQLDLLLLPALMDQEPEPQEQLEPLEPLVLPPTVKDQELDQVQDMHN